MIGFVSWMVSISFVARLVGVTHRTLQMANDVGLKTLLSLR